MRELQEETGLKGAYIRQFHTFTAPDRDPRERIITIAYYALVRMLEVTGGDDAADARDVLYRHSTPSCCGAFRDKKTKSKALPETFSLLQDLY